METEIWPNLLHACTRAGRSGADRQRAHVRAQSRPLGAVSRAPASGLRSRRDRGGAIGRRRAALRVAGRAAPTSCAFAATSSSIAARPPRVRLNGQALRARYAAAAPAVGRRQHACRRGTGGTGGPRGPARRAAAMPLLVLAPRHRPRFEEVATLLEEKRRVVDALQRRGVRGCHGHGRRCPCCCSTPWASSRISTRRPISPSSAEAWCRSAATTCSSPPRSGWPRSPVRISTTRRTSRAC